MMNQMSQMTLADAVYTTEFPRFLKLFDQLAQFGEAWLDRAPADKLDWVPIENSSMKFGDRVSRITIKGLTIHVAVGERMLLEGIQNASDGAVIPIPKNKDLEDMLNAPDWREQAKKLHEENLRNLRENITPEHLQRTIFFADHEYTGMGLLWAIYAHRSFHLGNIDIYVRQSDTISPDFFRFPADVMA